MEKKEIDKILKPKLHIVYIVVLLYLCIAALCMGFVFSKAYELRKNPLNLAELVSSGSEEEGVYVSLNIAYLPKLLARDLENDHNLYYAIDEEENVYIVSLSTKTYDYLKSIAEETTGKLSSTYLLNGFTYKMDAQIESFVLRDYKEVFPNIKLTSKNLYEHIGKIYVDENKSPVSHLTVDFYKAIVMVGIFFLIIVFGYIVPVVLKSKKISKNQKLVEELRIELEHLTDNKYQKYRIYLTKNYMIAGAQALKYEDILWAYILTESRYGIKIGKSLIVYTRDKKKHVMISAGPKDNLLDTILKDIQKKNPNIKIGDNKENKKFFENYKKSN